MTGGSVRLVERTMWLLSCSISRQTQKSLSDRNVWVGWMSLVMSEFVFGKVRLKKRGKMEREREGNKGEKEIHQRLRAATVKI